MQSQNPLRCHQIHVIVLACWPLGRRKVQATRHAQMQHQDATLGVQQQIFASPSDPQNCLTHQRRRRNTQWPAQGLAHVHGQDASASDSTGKTQSRNLNFG